jgi:xylose isomerase
LALRRAAAMQSSDQLDALVRRRYSSWRDSDVGRLIESGQARFDDLAAWVAQNGEPQQRSGKQEAFEVVFNQQLHQF